MVSVCAACHGVNGLSVSDHIPNLAAQRAPYLISQLEAFKDGSRKSEIMSAVAGRLNTDAIANVAAYFSSLGDASERGKSAFLPNVAKTRVTFPANYETAFNRYHIANDTESAQIKHYYANEQALSAARAGRPLPNGSAIIVEIYSAKLGSDKKPVIGHDGAFIAEQVRSYTAMARGAGWGNDVPELLRNDDWNYAIFSATRQLRTTTNQAECLACHVPASKSNYVFTMTELAKPSK